ncbi:putative TetR-family transcriptional regulator [Pseudooceanicola batsensis HTCC2597]|uniref:Putative TetR-family transcriptional regulator n=1 Tax=Pseudooceanicola batsensis (strain ATCC BAA-863 / DSM 15984 / KCTC 12145 / HTCC2597) TaxID=252305 RepID=A3TUI7_PSEBH|nr:TetR/AcrR family transcriptional regulator [Pseudooceanicola batsensis]EAQ04183.1 putative TetR-family transcriptional regulator [Pseudooceanicola batsensis HTCC2597]
MSRTKKDDKPAGWRKAEIIEAAAQCFMERGYHATTVDDVATRLNATKGRIYHHYATKTDLFFDVHRTGMDRLFSAIRPVHDRGGPARERLVAMLLAHARAMLEHHTYETVVAQGVQVHRFDQTTEGQRQTMRDLIATRDTLEQLFKSTLEDAIAEGTLAARDVSIAVKVLLGGLQWSIFWYRPQPGETEADRVALAEKMVAPLVAGLRAAD